jgi:hypothetical protein
MLSRLARPRTRAVVLLSLCLALSGLGTATAASARVAVGISDENTTFFYDSKFTKLHVRVARFGIPWNTMTRPSSVWRNRVKAWLDAAATDHVTPLITFTGDGNYVPSSGVYTAAIRKFVKKYPKVKNYTAWNEPDWVYRSLSRHPRLAASYYNDLVTSCGRGCTVAAGDVYLPASSLGPWLRAYIKGLHHKPKAWAIHPYDDVRGHATAQIRTLEHYTSGAIWLDEISGVETRGHWSFPDHQSVNAANRDERFLFSLPHRFHRITAIYHYLWQAYPKAPWDSGLIGTNGKPRPAYYTFAAAARGHLV